MRVCYPAGHKSAALALAQQLGCDVYCAESVAAAAAVLRSDAYFFWLSPHALRLHRNGDRYGVYLSMREVTRRARSRRKSLLAKALGIKHHGARTVLDATGGFGLDSMLMSRWGCTVTVLERARVAFALLQDGIQRFVRQYPDCIPPRAVLVDFARFPAAAGDFDVVYLDPMFGQRHKTAQPNKRAQYLSSCLEETTEQEELVQLIHRARGIAKQRAVLKRRRHDPIIAQPNWQILGRSIRLDVFKGG